MIRKATAIWNGRGIDGQGKMSTASGVINDAPFDAKTRFDKEQGTSPEELVAAAHASCFVMKLSFNLQEAGFVADELKAECKIEVKNFQPQYSKIELKAKVKDISEDKFEELVRDAEKNCPISQLLNTEISVEYTLN